MADFERYQTMMLDHVYGLLDPEQTIELEVFLATTPEGEALRQQAEQWKQRLLQAAKSEFPDLQFAPPAKTAGRAPSAKPAMAMGNRSERSKAGGAREQQRSWAPWAIGVSIVAVLVGFGIPMVRTVSAQMEEAHLVRVRQAEFEKADKEHNNYVAAYNARQEVATREERLAAQQGAEIAEEFKRSLAEARKAIEDKQFIVRLSGPERAQPGAPNEWQVDMYKRDGQMSMPNKVEWQVKDQTGQVVFADSKQAAFNQFSEPPIVKLPVSFWDKVKPDSDLTLEVVAYGDKLKSTVNARIPLARPVFVTHLATDKPLYKQGENVFFRSLTLDRATFKPPEKDMTLEFRITMPGGQPEPILVNGVPLRGSARGFVDANNPNRDLLGPDKKPLRGIGCGQFGIPLNAPGGEYVLSVVDVTPSFDEVKKQFIPKQTVLETRKFNVIEYKPEHMLKTLEFDGKSYGAGDVVMVKCTGTPIQGGKKKLAVGVSVIVDGQNVQVNHPALTDEDGVIRLKFTLPRKITNGVGNISVTFIDGAGPDVITRPIPLVGRIIKVEFFPEGGDLIQNVPNRVYFQATTPTGKPADLKGYITDGSEVVAEVATLTDAENPGVNRGQGVFTFTPKTGKYYYLKVQKPTGIIEPPVISALTSPAVARAIGLCGNSLGFGLLNSAIVTGFELPKAKADGVVLTALDPVTNPEQPIRVRLQVGKGKKSLHVGAYARGNLIDHQNVDVEAGKPVELKLKPSTSVGGVTRLTVFEEKPAGEGKVAQMIPVAERLVYCKPVQRLNLDVSPDKTRYNPGSQVGLDLRATNEEGKDVPAIVMVAVVNQSVLTMADEKTGRLMPTHFLLASEVKKPQDLEHADFLLSDNAKAPEALDLLLGTQGWRRFAEQNKLSPNAKPDREVDRLLVANGQKQVPFDTYRQEIQKVYAQFLPKMETVLARMGEAQKANEVVLADLNAVRQETDRLNKIRTEAHDKYHNALAQLQQDQDDGSQHRSALLVRFCVGLLLISGLCLGVGLVRRSSNIGYFATAAGCFALCAFALLGSSLAGREGDSRRQEVALNNARLQLSDGIVVAGVDEDANAEPVATEMEMKADRAGMGGGAGDDKAKRLAKGLKPAHLLDEAQKGNAGPLPMIAKPPVAPMRGPNQPFTPVLNMAANVGVGGAPPRFGAANGAQANDQLRIDGIMKDARGKFDANMLRERDGKKAGEALAKQQRANAFGQLRQLQLRRQEYRELEQAEKVFGAKAGKAEAAAMLAAAPEPPEAAFEWQLLQASQETGFYVREFKFHKVQVPNQPETRDDFTETVYWHPVLVLPETGRADVQFQLSDSIARYQVLVAGHTLDGRIGAVVQSIEARKPFTVDPKVPIEITSSDRIDVPIRVVNDSDVRRAVTFNVAPNGLTPAGGALKLEQGAVRDWLELAANQSGRKVIGFRSTKKEGDVSLTVVGTSDPIEAPDQILRTFRVVPDGFPASGAVSDLLEKRANATITLPEMVKGTLKVQVNVYPTTLADLQKGLESLMREPGGCFEQTSTSNYPNLLVLDYLKTSDQAKPELTLRAKDMLDRGYAKLVGFECPDSGANNARHGFEWFGQMDQQHQALTAYGLLQFKDLANAYPGKVDPELIKRTQQYLLGQQNPNKEGFKRNARALDTFGRAPDYITNAYIVWALTESDPYDKEDMTDLVKQLNYLKKLAKDDAEAKNDPYFLALVANALLHRPTNGNREEAVAILERIVEQNLKNGLVDGAKTSITRSGGRDLQIETTALAVLGWLRSGEPTKFVMPIKEATKWIGQQRGGYGGFGSTQSTILALKALIEHTKASRKPAEGGTITLTVNGKTFKKTFTEKDLEVITLDIEKPEEIFKQGVNEAQLEITTKQAYPFSLAWSCSTSTPLSSDKRLVDVAAKLDRTKVVEGETARVEVSLMNRVDVDQGMAVAIVGLPGGCRVPADLKELTKLREDGKIAFFEIRGREVVLYWRALKPKEQIDVSFGVICEIPGEYAGPASRGYLYYNADHKHWVNPLQMTIAPANQQGEEDVASK